MKKSGTRRKILHLLKTNDGLSAAELATHLDIGAMGVRQHLYELQSQGYVIAESEGGSIGRPEKIWRLGEKSKEFFPDGHEELLAEMLSTIKKALGREALDAVISLRAVEQQRGYERHLLGIEGVKERLEELAKLRSREGYMAEVEMIERDQFLFVEQHCPICAAARSCSSFCKSELQIFESLIPNGFAIERVEHLMEGDRRCCYRVFREEEKDFAAT